MYLWSLTVDIQTIFQNIQVILEEPEDYWNLCMEWLTLGSYFLISWHSVWLKQDSYNINFRCLYIISMHHMEQTLLFYLMLMIVSIGIHLNLLEMVCGYSRKLIPCELPSILQLVYFDQYFTDEVTFRFSRLGYILYFYCGWVSI